MKFLKTVCSSIFCLTLCSVPVSAELYEVRVNDSLNLRQGPGSNTNYLASLPNKTRVDVLEKKGSWGRIKYNGQDGWICLDYTTKVSNIISPKQYRVNVSDCLRLRSEPNRQSRIIQEIGNGTVVTVTEVCENWGKVTYNGNVGWLCMDYLREDVHSNIIQPKQYRVNVSDCLRFRSEPNKQSRIIQEIGNGTVVTVTEICENWGKATYNGNVGWLCMDYLREDVPEVIGVTALPVNTGTSVITQAYKEDVHKGIDIGSYGGKKIDIFAVKEGYIENSVCNNEYNDGRGNYIVVKHSNGYTTKYFHLDSVCVRAGDRVTAGQKIGVMGTTGRSTGVHLHLQVEKDGKHIDPFKFVDLSPFIAR